MSCWMVCGAWRGGGRTDISNKSTSFWAFVHRRHLSAITRLFLSRLIGFIFATYAVVSTLAPCDGVMAVWTYDCASLLYIKESMERRFTDWDSYKQTFPLPFVSLPASPSYVLLFQDLCNPKKRVKRRGSRAGVHVKTRRAARNAAISRSDRTCYRWLKLVPVQQDACGGGPSEQLTQRHLCRLGRYSHRWTNICPTVGIAGSQVSMCRA